MRILILTLALMVSGLGGCLNTTHRRASTEPTTSIGPLPCPPVPSDDSGIHFPFGLTPEWTWKDHTRCGLDRQVIETVNHPEFAVNFGSFRGETVSFEFQRNPGTGEDVLVSVEIRSPTQDKSTFESATELLERKYPEEDWEDDIKGDMMALVSPEWLVSVSSNSSSSSIVWLCLSCSHSIWEAEQKEREAERRARDADAKEPLNKL